jgi:DNA-directed RNA polymerase specialized sigma24 family protein
MSEENKQGFFANEPTFIGHRDATHVWPPRGEPLTPSRIAQLLFNLPELERDALRLRHVERMPLDQIAFELQVSETEVARLLLSGARQLKLSQSNN